MLWAWTGRLSMQRFPVRPQRWCNIPRSTLQSVRELPKESAGGRRWSGQQLGAPGRGKAGRRIPSKVTAYLAIRISTI
jgi:hypothetical protein